MDRPEFLRMKMNIFPDDVIEQYNLKDKVNSKGHIILRVEKGMYRLPQAGIISQRILEQRLNAVGYSQSTTTPGLWTYKWRPITFTLCVEDFGVEYGGWEHAQHLKDTLQKNYTISHNW